MQCEYLTDPLGIDVELPRFSWKIPDSDNLRGQKQTGYQILIASTQALLDQNQGDIWNSGKVASSQSALVQFAGKKLLSSENYYWKVQISDNSGKTSAWSKPARFSMGLLNPEDWKGYWIQIPKAPETKHIWFRKALSLDEAAASAFIHVASVGYHELYVNGEKADDRILAPTLTRLDKRVLYVTYDIAKLLKKGENVIALWQGPGWARYEYFNLPPVVRVQLNGQTTSNKQFSLVSDETWRCAMSNSDNTGKCAFTDNGGERIVAGMYIPDWNRVGFDDSKWVFAKKTDTKATLSAQMIEPTRIIETIKPVKIVGEGVYRVDMGKNFTGWIEINFKGLSPGSMVTMKVADDLTTIQDGTQMSQFMGGASGKGTFKNRFNYVTGRYITIEGLKQRPELADITGYAIGTDLKRTGHFSSSNKLFNDIYETDLWTYRANTIEGYTSDCPHRERLGYGEEAFATAWGIGLPNYQAGAFYTKLVRDWSDVQEENGWIHHTAPQINQHFGGPMWSSAGLNISWEFYETYGDKRILELTYPSSKRWLEFLNDHLKEGLLVPYTDNFGKFLGDWAAPGARREMGNSPQAAYFNNCVYAMNLETFIQIATILGKNDDVALYKKRLEALKPLVQKAYFNPATNLYSDGNQVQLSFPLLVDITPASLRKAVTANFKKEFEETHPYFDMGSSGLPVLLKYLVGHPEEGQFVSAYLNKTTEPSYGYFISRGESTWPEYWSVDVSSRVHTCYTGIASWFIKSLCGISPDAKKPGYQSFIIKPIIVPEVTFAEAAVESLYGSIESRWERNGNNVTLKVTVPPNSEATVYVPATGTKNLAEGGLSLQKAKGVTLQKTEGNYAVVHVTSGHYIFSSTVQ
ncbi:alpha-rhamnosidase [Bacteroidia bacterium]|nr:alpha-rhamnosidase [Bacteroidia bacterium]